jgi:hypothetical protein
MNFFKKIVTGAKNLICGLGRFIKEVLFPAGKALLIGAAASLAVTAILSAPLWISAAVIGSAGLTTVAYWVTVISLSMGAVVSFFASLVEGVEGISGRREARRDKAVADEDRRVQDKKSRREAFDRARERNEAFVEGLRERGGFLDEPVPNPLFTDAIDNLLEDGPFAYVMGQGPARDLGSGRSK